MPKTVMIICLLLALIAALAYVLMGVGVLKPGSLAEDGEAMPSFFYVIPAAYVLMGAVIFFKKRWLLILDTAITVFTIVVFYVMYPDQPDVMWSAPGLITKIAQVLLLAGLLYLIARFPKKEKTNTAK